MSERLSSVEIEDVLSSIRRLVSDDLRPVAKPAVVEAPPAAPADKLILTPALRIAPDEGGDPLPEPAPAAAFQSVRRGTGRVEAVMGEVARGLDGAEAEPDAAPPQGRGQDWFEFQPEAAPAAPVPVAEGEGDEDAVWSVADQPAGIAPDDGGAGGELAETWDDVPPGGMVDEYAQEAVMAHPEEPADLPDWMQPVDAHAPRTGAEAPEPDLSPAARPEDWADAAEAEIRRELEEDVSAGMRDRAEQSVFARFDADDHDDRPFDEEMLRDLVRDIIREELQGALGERITRNVRKLVRSEIARALAVRDFE